MTNHDGRVWHVYSYPDNVSLHEAGTYEAADDWRRRNNDQTYIAPKWPKSTVKRFGFGWRVTTPLGDRPQYFDTWSVAMTAALFEADLARHSNAHIAAFRGRLEADAERVRNRPWWQKLLGIGIVPKAATREARP